MKGFIYILLFVFSVIMFSCEKAENYPINPVIEFKNMFLVDTTDPLGNIGKAPVLRFSFTDGDGDIGLREGDTIGFFDPDSLYYHNLFLTLYEKVDGEFVEIDDLLFPFYYRIPYVGREETGKSLKGDILVDIIPLFYDTVRFDFYMVDRALHRSNTETTGEIVLNTGL